MAPCPLSNEHALLFLFNIVFSWYDDMVNGLHCLLFSFMRSRLSRCACTPTHKLVRAHCCLSRKCDHRSYMLSLHLHSCRISSGDSTADIPSNKVAVHTPMAPLQEYIFKVQAIIDQLYESTTRAKVVKPNYVHVVFIMMGKDS